LINIDLLFQITTENPRVGSSILSLATINSNIIKTLRIFFIYRVAYSYLICVNFVPKINTEAYLEYRKLLI